jgi:hypothetical protein
LIFFVHAQNFTVQKLHEFTEHLSVEATMAGPCAGRWM